MEVQCSLCLPQVMFSFFAEEGLKPGEILEPTFNVSTFCRNADKDSKKTLCIIGDQIIRSAVKVLERSEISEALKFTYSKYDVRTEFADTFDMAFHCFEKLRSETGVKPDSVLFHMGDNLLDGKSLIFGAKLLLHTFFGQMALERSKLDDDNHQLNLIWSAMLQRKVYTHLRNFAAGPALRKKLVQIATKLAKEAGFAVIRNNNIRPSDKQMFIKFSAEFSPLALYKLWSNIDHHFFDMAHPQNALGQYKTEKKLCHYSRFHLSHELWKISQDVSDENLGAGDPQQLCEYRGALLKQDGETPFNC